MRLHEIWTVNDASHIASHGKFLFVVGSGEIVCYTSNDASIYGHAAFPNATTTCVQMVPCDLNHVITLCSDGFVYLLSMVTHHVVAKCDIMFSAAVGATHLYFDTNDELHVYTDDACFILTMPELRLKTRVVHTLCGESQSITAIAPPFFGVAAFTCEFGAVSAQVVCTDEKRPKKFDVKKSGVVQRILQLDNGKAYAVCDMTFETNRVLSIDCDETAFLCDGFAAATDGHSSIAFVTPDAASISIVNTNRRSGRSGLLTQNIMPLPESIPAGERVHDLMFVGKKHIAIRTSDDIVRVCRFE